MKPCILLCTCDKYTRLARLTIDLIGRRWPAHPSIFVCGASSSPGGRSIPLADPPGDWIGITRSALRVLRREGIRQCYLILEDHPPIGLCNAAALNGELPDWMDRLGAAYIGLYGWDQRTRARGTNLGPEYGYLQRQADDYPWRWSLHPGLWNLEALDRILAVLAGTECGPGGRTAWAFERRTGAADFPLPPELRGSSYRVCGLRLLGGPSPGVRRIMRAAEFRVFDVLRLAARAAGGMPLLRRLDAALMCEYFFHDGPYPLYWSGVMRKGKLNEDLRRFLRRRRREAEWAEYQEAVADRNPIRASCRSS